MARTFNFSKALTNAQLQNGIYRVVLSDLTEKMNKSNCLMYVVEMTIQAPEEFEGKKLQDYLNFGKRPFKAYDGASEERIAYAELDDPMAEHELSHKYSSGIQSFRKYLEAVGVDVAKDWTMEQLQARFISGNDKLLVGLKIDKEGFRRITKIMADDGKERPRLLDEETPSNGRRQTATPDEGRQKSAAERAAELRRQALLENDED